MSTCICPRCDQADQDRLPDVRGVAPIHERRCRELVTDDRWGPWCNSCNVRRFARIDEGFERLGLQP